MSGLTRARARQAAMLLAALLSAFAVTPVLAYAQALSFSPLRARAQSASVPKGTYWLGGITSQGDPVAAAVSHQATTVDVRIALDMKCTSATPVFTDRTYALPVTRNGAVLGYNLTIPADPKDGILGGFDRFGGQMNKARTRLTGHWRMQLIFSNTDGTKDTCDSGAVSFTAS